MRKTALLFGLVGGVLVTALQLIEYRFLVLQHSLEIYGALVAILFAALGIWLGLRITGRAERVVVKEVEVQVPAPSFAPDDRKVAEYGITPREMEILELIAAGLSNREIAERLFVSENTVKTHSGRLYGKLSARRRTEAVRRAKLAGLIP